MRRGISFSILVVPALTLFLSEQPNTSVTSFFNPGDSGFSVGDSTMQIGEELTYNVSYAFVDIGQVRVTVLDKVSDKGTSYYNVVAHIDSYKNIPFVDLHSVYESHFDALIYSLWFRSRTKKDSRWHYFTYEFDYPKHGIYIHQGTWGTNSVDRRDTLSVGSFSQDGLSIFYYARQNLFSRKTLTIPTVVSEQQGNTVIHFTNQRTHEKIDAIDYPVDLIHFEGNAGFVGIFGLTGDFEGWFSNDAARVPVLAKMKVIIGDVKIELMKWKRRGWVPPKYQE